MASSADRMAAGAGFGALAKADELKKRLWFTVGAPILLTPNMSLAAGAGDIATDLANSVEKRQSFFDQLWFMHPSFHATFSFFSSMFICSYITR